MEMMKKNSEACDRILLLAKIESYTKSNEFVKVRFTVSKNLIKIFFKQQLQRTFFLSEIDAITYSRTSSQFIIHIKDDIDERFSSEAHRDEIIEMILYLQTVVNSTNNPKIKFFLLSDESLSLFVTSEEDLEDGLILRPDFRYLTLMNYKKFLKLTESAREKTTVKRNSGHKKINVDDFELLKVLGIGAHGKVLLVSRKKYPQTRYAMKILKKQHIIDANQLEHTIAEKMILSNVNHPFLVSMKYTFQTESKLYFVMEFMQGGELFQHLKREGCFTEEQTKFFCACLILALGHLHNSNYIYRDLKPENILLDEKGYLKLSDFGLAKEVQITDLAQTFCGTPEYLAPEVILNKGCNRPADWWSLGILAYEMLFGAPPFYSTDVQEMYKKTITKTLKFPQDSDASDLAMDFISGLLVKRSENRLGSIADSLEVMNHPWFSDISWSNLLAKKIDPPYKPDFANWQENFDQEFIQQGVNDSKCELNPGLINDFRKKFERFSFDEESRRTIEQKRNQTSSSLGKIFKEQFQKGSSLVETSVNSDVKSNLKSHKSVAMNFKSDFSKSVIFNQQQTCESNLVESQNDENINSCSSMLVPLKYPTIETTEIDKKWKILAENFSTRDKSMFDISEEKVSEESSPTKVYDASSILFDKNVISSMESQKKDFEENFQSIQKAMDL